MTENNKTIKLWKYGLLCCAMIFLIDVIILSFSYWFDSLHFLANSHWAWWVVLGCYSYSARLTSWQFYKRHHRPLHSSEITRIQILPLALPFIVTVHQFFLQPTLNLALWDLFLLASLFGIMRLNFVFSAWRTRRKIKNQEAISTS